MADVSKKREPLLPWSRAAVSALLALAVILPLAIGRMIHWDIVATLSGIGVLGLTLAFRYVR